MFIDYYAILEIPQTATKAELKSAYKKQAVKWHPDKNSGSDTTQKMQEINAAYIFLNDDEARTHYDREYPRFRKFQQENKKEDRKQEQQDQKKKEEPKSEQKTTEKKTEKEEYSTYQFDDEILKKWMENARKQAMKNVQEMIIEFRDSSLIGFGTFFKTALMAIVIGVIFFIIVLILKSI